MVMVQKTAAHRRKVDVAIGVLAQQQGGRWQVLVTRRPADKVYGGYWEFPGGKFEPGETAQACLVREFAEEVGLQVRAERALGEVEYVYPHAHVRLHPFLCSWLSGQTQNLQVAEHRWVPAAELAEYRFPEANQPVVLEVMHILAETDVTK